MKPTSLAERLNQSNQQKIEVQDANSVAATRLLNQINQSGIQQNPVIVSTYASQRNDDIRNSLQIDGYDKIINPSDAELTYVNSVFQSKGFHKIENVTYEAIMNIGKSEFEDLNRKMKEFTKNMGGVDTVGICELMGDLSKSIDQVDLESIWQKAVNAKPSAWAVFLSMFDKSARSKSLNGRYKQLQTTLSNNGKMLETKLQTIEQDLINQKLIQEKNIKDLEKSFEIYYNSFIELRKQFALVVYLEHSFKQQFENFKTDTAGISDLVIDKKRSDYEERLNDIQNKRLIIHKSMLQLPLIVEQNKNLGGVSKTLLKEIENTRVSSFPMIRGNLQTIGIAIMTQKSLNSNQSASNLEKNAALLASEVTGELAKQGATLSASLRLKEAETVQALVDGMKTLKTDMESLSNQSQQMSDNAKNILMNATNELIVLTGGNK